MQKLSNCQKLFILKRAMEMPEALQDLDLGGMMESNTAKGALGGAGIGALKALLQGGDSNYINNIAGGAAIGGAGGYAADNSDEIKEQLGLEESGGIGDAMGDIGTGAAIGAGVGTGAGMLGNKGLGRIGMKPKGKMSAILPILLALYGAGKGGSAGKDYNILKA